MDHTFSSLMRRWRCWSWFWAWSKWVEVCLIVDVAICEIFHGAYQKICHSGSWASASSVYLNHAVYSIADTLLYLLLGTIPSLALIYISTSTYIAIYPSKLLAVQARTNAGQGWDIISTALTVSHMQSPYCFPKNHKNGIRHNGTLADKSTIGSLLHHHYPSCARALFHPNPPTQIRNPNTRQHCRLRVLVQSSQGVRCHIKTVCRSVAGTGG